MFYFNAKPGSKGQKRTLEKKKFEFLGKIETLKSVLSTFLELNCDMEVFNADTLYYNMFRRMHKLYEAQIDQAFLIQMIYLKNQKRESKRFIDFLQGAKIQLKKVLNNENLILNSNQVGIQSLYEDAYKMVEEKLCA